MSDSIFVSDSSRRTPVEASGAYSLVYSADDVQQILTIAMNREISSAAQLEEMAQELSIDEAALSYAMDVWRSHKVAAQKKQQRRQRFYRYELFPYLLVNGFLLLLDISIAGGITWSIYPLLGWGLGLLLGMGICDGTRLSKARSACVTTQEKAA